MNFCKVDESQLQSKLNTNKTDTKLAIEMEKIRISNVPITLSWENIDVSTPSSGRGIIPWKAKIPGKEIIKNGNISLLLFALNRIFF